MTEGKEAPFALMVKSLESFLKGKKIPPENGARIPLTKAETDNRDMVKRESNAKRINGEKNQATLKTRAERYKAKIQDAIVKTGKIPTIEQKIVLLGEAVNDRSVVVLQENYKNLTIALTTPEKNSKSRLDIEKAVQSITDTASRHSGDIEIQELAREMKKLALGQVSRNAEYFSNDTPEARKKFGSLFYTDIPYDQLVEDKRYLRAITDSETTLPRQEADPIADQKLAKDMVSIAKTAGQYDLDAAFMTLPYREPMNMDMAMRKIQRSDTPEWIKKLAHDVGELNPQTATTLAEMADASRVDAAILDDPNYLFYKGAQLSAQGSSDFTNIETGTVNFDGLKNIEDVNNGILEQIQNKNGNDSTFDLDKQRIEPYFSLATRMGERGMSPATAGGQEFSQASIDYITDTYINDLSRPEAERIHAQDLVSLFDEYNKSLSSPIIDAEQAAYNFFNKYDHSSAIDTWRRFVLSDPSDVLWKKIEEIRKTAEEVSNSRYKQRDLERGWSSLYLSYDYMKRAMIDPMEPTMALQDEQEMYSFVIKKGGLFPGTVNEGVKRTQQSLVHYITSDDYATDRIDFLSNPKNWGYKSEKLPDGTVVQKKIIPDVEGQSICIDNGHGELVVNTEHPWYKVVDKKGHPIEVREFKKKFSEIQSAHESVEQLYIGFNTGKSLSELKLSASNVGDAAQFMILTENPFNRRINGIYQRKGVQIMTAHLRNGKAFAPDGGTMKTWVDEVVREALEHKDEFRTILGENVNISDDKLREKIEASVSRIFKLNTITGRTETILSLALTPREAQGGNLSPDTYGGSGAGDQLATVLSPFRKLLLRWDLLNQKQFIRLMRTSRTEVMRYGIDEYWKHRFDHMEKWAKNPDGSIKTHLVNGKIENVLSDEFRHVAEWAFYITEPNNPENVDNGLSWLRWEDNGKKRLYENRPHTLEELSVKDLQKWILAREGISLIDARLSGGWNLTEWGVALKTQLRCYEDRYKHLPNFEGIAIHEQVKLAYGNYLNDASDHESLHKTKHKLIDKNAHFNRNHPEEGVLIRLGKTDPLASIEALHAKGDHRALEWAKHASANKIYFDAMDHPTDNVQDRFDILVGGTRMRLDYIDEIRIEQNLGPQDWTNITPEDQAIIDGVCERTKVDPKTFTDLMKNASTFSLEHETLEHLSEPSVMTYFATVHSPEKRFAFLDSETKGTVYDEDRIQAYSDIATKDPNASGSFLSRFYGDSGNANDGLKYLPETLNSDDVDKIMDGLEKMTSISMMSGGDGTRAMTVQSLGAGILGESLMDWEWDAIGSDAHKTIAEISNAERASGKGALTLNRAQYDDAWHRVERIAGWKFHEQTPGLAHAIDKENKMAINIGGLSIPTIRLYNTYAFAGLGGIVIAGAIVATAISGFKKSTDSSGGGGGGGGDPHH